MKKKLISLLLAIAMVLSLCVPAMADVAVTSVTLDAETLYLRVNEKATLTATVAPANATNQEVTWTSDAEATAAVVDGVVTANAEGTATITATAGGESDTCNVTVLAGNTAARIGNTAFENLEAAINATPVQNVDTWTVGSTKYTEQTDAESAAANLVQQRTYQYYVDGADPVEYYLDDATAKESLVSSNGGNGKYYLSSDASHSGNDGNGWETEDAAKEAQVFQITDEGTDNGKYTFNEATDGPWESDAEAKNAAKTQLTTVKFVKMWKIQDDEEFNYSSKEDAIAAILDGTVLKDENYYLKTDSDFAGPSYENLDAVYSARINFHDGDDKWYLKEDYTGDEYASEELAAGAAKNIVLMADCGDDGYNDGKNDGTKTEFDFKNKEINLDLNGHKLMGKAKDAASVTVSNSGAVQNTLAATGIYKENVSAFVADGYDAKVPASAVEGATAKTEVFSNEDNGVFNVEVEVTADDTDYDTSTTFPDVYADEYVTVKVKVTGARYASADFTLTWDKNLFVDETASWDLPQGWEGHGDDETRNHGYTSYRFTGAHEKVAGKPQEEYFEDGEVIGTFTMRALYVEESVVKSQQFTTKDAVIEANARGSYSVFTVKSSSGSETAKVIGSWRKAKLDGITTALTTAQLKDDVAHIILMDAMTGDVSAQTGLSYKATPQNLLDPTYNTSGFSALVGGQAPKGNDGLPSAKVQTVVYTKADYEDVAGTPLKDGSGNALYYTSKENYTNRDRENGTSTEVTEWPAYVEGKEPKTPAYGEPDTKLTTNNIQGTNAGDYVVCYRITAPGYASVTGVKNVNIAKQKVDLVWVAPAYETGVTGGKAFNTGSGTDATYKFVGEYDTVGFKAPAATFTNLNNGTVNVNSTWTSGPNADKSLKDVGVYEFTAKEDPNYEFNNPTCDVKVKGLTITGWTLQATNGADPVYEAEKPMIIDNLTNKEAVQNGVIWRDGEERPIGSLVVAEGASFKYNESERKYMTTGENPVEVTNVVVTYEYSEGNYYKTEADLTGAPAGAKIGDEIWKKIDETDDKKESELGKYKLRMTVTADNYEKMVQIVNFEIKNPIFVTENLEYVAGYSIVLAYTNETGVSFKYGSGDSAVKMYDVTDFGYKYNNNNYFNGNTPHAHVYAIVVKGTADTSLVYASNEAAAELSLPGGRDDGNYNAISTAAGYKGNVYVNDVNNKAGTQVDMTKWVDLDDITAIQSIYNVNANNMLDMQVVLRADVNRDKKVDVNGDVAQALAFYLKPSATT